MCEDYPEGCPIATPSDSKNKNFNFDDEDWFSQFKYLNNVEDLETYDLDVVFVKYIISRLKKYISCAEKVINLDFPNVKFKDEIYTVRQSINYIVNNFTQYLENNYLFEDNNKLMKDTFEMFGQVFPLLWW